LPLLAAPPAAEEPQQLTLFETGIATLDLGPRSVPVGYAVSPLGPLFTLHSVDVNLGGELNLGPLRQSHELTLDGTTYIFGPLGAAVTVGTEIYPLSQTPVPAEDGLKVPLDLFETIYGEKMGYSFDWNAESRTLTVRRLAQRQVPVSIDLVHLQGVTTVVLQFPTRPRYRIHQAANILEVELIGDLLDASSVRSLPTDPLVRDIKLGQQEIQLVLAPGTEAEDYTLREPFRLVFDVYRKAPKAAPQIASPTLGQRSDDIRTIVIDPGHGGSEDGAIGPSGTAEKDITLTLARTLRTRLEERMPVRVVLTRTEDADLPLDTRTALANQQKADLFISLHLNSNHHPGAQGAETFFSSLEASDEYAAQSAASENLATGSSSGDPLYDLQLILWDLAQSRYLAESQRFASLVQDELNEALGLRNRGVKQAPFRVLMGAAMPAVLVECGFLSNPKEEQKLLDPAYRAQLIDALVRAVLRYRAQLTGVAEALQ
jgi:N-acetylmuramoyl-L-alanine amidase